MQINAMKMPDNLSPKDEKALTKLKSLSKEFESFFMKEVVKSMRETVPKGGLLDGGNAEEIYRSMYDDQLSADMADKGGSGIAESLYKQMSAAYLGSAKQQNQQKG